MTADVRRHRLFILATAEPAVYGEALARIEAVIAGRQPFPRGR